MQHIRANDIAPMGQNYYNKNYPRTILFQKQEKIGGHPVYGLVTPSPGVPVYRPQHPVLIGQSVWQPSPYCS